jgi:hypothetical protein
MVSTCLSAGYLIAFQARKNFWDAMLIQLPKKGKGQSPALPRLPLTSADLLPIFPKTQFSSLQYIEIIG